MILEFEVNKIIRDLLKTHGFNHDIVSIPMGFYSCMAYDPENKVIKFNHHNINGTHYQHFPEMDIYNFTTIITYHEIGHVLDVELNGYRDRSRFDMEMAAWEHADALIPPPMVTDYTFVKNFHMEIQKKNKLRVSRNPEGFEEMKKLILYNWSRTKDE